jgi:hypothetical protein
MICIRDSTPCGAQRQVLHYPGQQHHNARIDRLFTSGSEVSYRNSGETRMLWLDTTKRGSCDRAKEGYGTRNHQVWDSAKHWNVKTQINGLWRRPGTPEIDEDTQIRQECELSLSKTPASRSCQLEVLDRYLTQRLVPVTDPEPAQEGFNSDSEPDNDLFQQANTPFRHLFKCNEWRILRSARPFRTLSKEKKNDLCLQFDANPAPYADNADHTLERKTGQKMHSHVISWTHSCKNHNWAHSCAKVSGSYMPLHDTSICLHQVALRQESMTDWVLQSAFYPRHTTACAVSSAPRELLLNNCHPPGRPMQTLPRSHNGVNDHGICYDPAHYYMDCNPHFQSHRVPPTGTAWHRLSPTGTTWHRLSPTGTTWHRPPPVGTSWRHLGTGLTFGKVYKESHFRLIDPFS